jgi:high affinity Mn2+ porin
LAGVVNGLSHNAQAFFAAGGLGLLIGDGALSYRPEAIMEAYYLIGINDWSKLTFDYQFVANPGYNSQRGPTSIGSTRLHLEF